MPVRLSDITKTGKSVQAKSMRLDSLYNKGLTRPSVSAATGSLFHPKTSFMEARQKFLEIPKVKNTLEEEEKAMANLLSIPAYVVSPPLREYIKKYRRGEKPLAFGDIPSEYIPKTVSELNEIAFPPPAPRPGQVMEGRPGIAKPFFGRLALEYADYYKPSMILTFKAVTKSIGMVSKPIGRFIAEKTPKRLKDVLLRNLTVGRGQPIVYQEAKRKTGLEVARGVRESEDVAMKLTIAPEDIRVVTDSGVRIIKKGQQIPQDQQKYIGRIFRKEIDLGGKQSRLLQKPELVERISKDMEVNVAFNYKIQAIREEIGAINKQLASTEKRAKELIGRTYRTDTGFIEKAGEVVREPRLLKSGKPSKRLTTMIKTEPITPKPPTKAPIPSLLAKEGEDILRTPGQVRKFATLEKPLLKNRKELLSRRKELAKQLEKEIRDIEIGVRANYDIFDREFSEQLRNHPKYQQLSEIAEEGRDIMDKWSKELIKSGIPSKQAQETIEQNVGEYMARMYPNFLVPEKAGFNQTKNLRLRLNGLKHRKDLTGTEFEKFVIKEPALPTAIRVREISTSIANNKLFNTVAQNPEWSASTNLTGKMVQMPNTPQLGALRGKWVIKEIAEDINQIVTSPSAGKMLYNQIISGWKFGKVVLNPAAQFRNMYSNTILLDLSGVNHARQAQLLPSILNDYLRKGKLYRMALGDGAIGGEFVSTEVLKIRDSYLKSAGGPREKILQLLKTPFKKAGDFYQANEQISKMIKYADVLSKTSSRELAAKEAQKWLFNYNEIPKFIAGAKHVSPFVTFTYKALPRLAETLVNNPMKIYKYYSFFNAWNEAARQTIGLNEKEYDQLMSTMPPWMSEDFLKMPTALLMPFTDKYGRKQIFNLEYILPIGMAPEVTQQGLLRGGISNPFYQALADIQKNRDFRNKPIVPEEPKTGKFLVPNDEAAKLQIEHVYRMLAPSLTPAIRELKGGYSFEKLMSAIEKRPDYMDRVKEVPDTLLDILAGLKITPIDVKENIKFRKIETRNTIKALQIEMYKVMNRKGVTEEEKEKERLKIKERIKKVINDSRRY